MTSNLAHGYRLVRGTPSVSEYLALRAESGLSERTADEAAAAMPGSWSAYYVVDDATGGAVGMGRAIGDGGWYFHILDMAVLPAHQRKGIGDAVLTALLADIAAASPQAFVNLIADEPGRRLYARHGFVETAPRSIGMALRLG